MDEELLIDALRFYLRQDIRLKRAGLEPLGYQPGRVESALWAHSLEAAARLARLRIYAVAQAENRSGKGDA